MGPIIQHQLYLGSASSQRQGDIFATVGYKQLNMNDIGVREIPWPFEGESWCIDLYLDASHGRASQTDAIEDTIDYARVSHAVIHDLETNPPRNPADGAQRAASFIVSTFGVPQARVVVRHKSKYISFEAESAS